MPEIRAIIARVLDVEPDFINDDLVRTKTEVWDSFKHLLLISELEDELGIKFTPEEVENIKTYPDLKSCIKCKL